MRDSRSRPVVRLGDPTDHGGEVLTALDMIVLGKPVTGEGCVARCPRCGGVFRIVPAHTERRHRGRVVAFEGDLTECGARLISTLPGR
ncbi:PAAR domain-containing protein [uncultured Pseudacidovorax sp.]|uniref:PAAR domain-containing protein n=1 Tax=uncultured Pseudacidovorax sp. TaxID=679313 RepID=UPI0025E9F6FA|nr:PAAR domain-containing protein [uncultured Pseudacidovorax sp.]